MPTLAAASCRIALPAWLASCSQAAPPLAGACPPNPAATITVLSRGWHTELGIPADELQGRLTIFRSIFPGARTIMFGYGKRTFMTARADRASEYLLGPFPGPAVIEPIGLSTSVQAAYGPGDSVNLSLPPGGLEKLSAFVWNDLAKDASGAPRLVGPGAFPGALFYAANSQYTLAHTCNTWVAEALHQAGLPINPAGAILSGQTMSRAAAASRQCPAATP